MSKNKQIKCVIFDCDGTLIDSEKLCIQAQVDILETVGVHVQYDWLKTNYQGVKIHNILDDLIDDKSFLEGDGIEQLIAQYRVRCNQLFETFLTPIDGVKEVLEILINKGIDICIASNAPHEKMKITLPLTKLQHYFEGRVFSAFDADKWKPDPDLLHFVMDKMNVSANECLFVDDSLAGVEAGVKAGVKTLYFAHDDPERDINIESHFLYKIHHLTDLLLYI